MRKSGNVINNEKWFLGWVKKESEFQHIVLKVEFKSTLMNSGCEKIFQYLGVSTEKWLE
jgi:hypothetical protein